MTRLELVELLDDVAMGTRVPSAESMKSLELICRHGMISDVDPAALADATIMADVVAYLRERQVLKSPKADCTSDLEST